MSQIASCFHFFVLSFPHGFQSPRLASLDFIRSFSFTGKPAEIKSLFPYKGLTPATCHSEDQHVLKWFSRQDLIETRPGTKKSFTSFAGFSLEHFKRRTLQTSLRFLH